MILASPAGFMYDPGGMIGASDSSQPPSGNAVRGGLRKWPVRSCVAALALLGIAQLAAIFVVERNILEATNATAGIAGGADGFATAQRFNRRWFLSHDTVTVSAPSATLSYWEFSHLSAARSGAGDGGHGATVLILPGWAGSAPNTAYLYRFAAVMVEGGYRVFMIDLRAQGESTGRTCSYGLLDRDDLRQVVDEMKQRGQLSGHLVLAGHSYGAAVAIQAAAAIPETRAVIAMAGQKDLLSIGQPFRFQVRDEFPRLFQLVRPLFSDPAVAVGVRAAAMRHGFNPGDASALIAMPLVDAPVLLIHGGMDACVPPPHSRELHAARPAATTLWIHPKDDHWAYRSDSAKLLDIRAWLGEVLSKG